MYRIIKESYNNYKNDFLVSDALDDIRYIIMEPFEIIFNIEKWNYEKNQKTENYKKVAEVLYYINGNINEFLEFKVFMWELEARNIIGEDFLVLSSEDKEEIIKNFKMFLNLTYWN
ncbi:hypothetical protein QUF55_08810 [Clostridiaceae bacterium HSG29]|nr:hypothetical protein [Clostridiaceae bacterium HSG29]